MVEEAMTARVEVFEAPDGEWYFHRKAANGEITSSSEGYTRKDDALKAAHENFPDLPIIIREER